MYNFWRQLRLVGGVVCIAAALFHLNVAVPLIGLLLIAVGTVNGLYSLEQRVEDLEKEKGDAKTEA